MLFCTNINCEHRNSNSCTHVWKKDERKVAFCVNSAELFFFVEWKVSEQSKWFQTTWATILWLVCAQIVLNLRVKCLMAADYIPFLCWRSPFRELQMNFGDLGAYILLQEIKIELILKLLWMIYFTWLALTRKWFAQKNEGETCLCNMAAFI